MNKQNREIWLATMAKLMKPKFKEAKQPLPKDITIRINFSGKINEIVDKSRNCVLAECRHGKDGKVFINIHPQVNDTVDISQILCHELIHAALGHGSGHGKKFREMADHFNLLPPMKSTKPGEQFVGWIKDLINDNKIGQYPKDEALESLDPISAKQHVNLRCPQCNYYAKTTLLNLYLGRLKCPCCDTNPPLLKKLERDLLKVKWITENDKGEDI